MADNKTHNTLNRNTRKKLNKAKQKIGLAGKQNGRGEWVQFRREQRVQEHLRSQART
jgi:hypothetical protein